MAFGMESRIAKPVSPDRSSEQKEKRERQKDIVRRWRERAVNWKPMENGNRVIPDKEDVERYLARRREQRAGFGSEAVGVAEAMVMELLDAEGVTQPYERKRGTRTVREGYNLFLEEGHVYPSSDLDDQLRGTDAILLLTDPEEGERASAFAIDVTIDSRAIQGKLGNDIHRVYESGEQLNRVYWYDTKSDEPDESFEEPKEGKIPVVNLSVHVPPEWAEIFADGRSGFDKAHGIMERLGPVVLRQMRQELELMAMRVLGLLRSSRGHIELIREPTAEEAVRMLKELEDSPRGKGRYSVRAIREGLERVLEAEVELVANGKGLAKEDERYIPTFISGFKGLRSIPMVEAAE